VKVTPGRFGKPGKLFARQRVLAGRGKMPLRGQDDDLGPFSSKWDECRFEKAPIGTRFGIS
jgi:hypothetical protein